LTATNRNDAPSLITFSWLLLLRWGAVASQIFLVLAIYLFFQIKLPVLILSAIIVFEAASNFYFYFLKKRKTAISDWLFALVMFLDVMLLTALLYYTGGPMNPFTFLYLIHIVLGAILMRPRWAWSLTGFTVLCYAALFFFPSEGLAETTSLTTSSSQPPFVCASLPLLEEHIRLHLQGMWIAFSVTAFFIVFFVGKIQKSLEEHQKTVAELEQEKARTEKLGSLATLAAGAAHEFSTPLSTIAVAAGEMLHTLKSDNGPQDLIEDAALIREQIDHCKEILYQMSADAGEHLGEAVEEFTLERLMAKILNKFSEQEVNLISFHNKVGGDVVRMPFRTLERIVRGLISNGLDASDHQLPVTVTCWRDRQLLYFEVSDQGHGMAPETLEKATEPFFTTKEPGKGLGLGLFLAQSAVERLGGSLSIHSELGKGTKVTVSFLVSEKNNPPAATAS